MNEDFRAHLAPLGPHRLKDRREDTSRCMFLDHRGSEEIEERKETEAFVLTMVSKESPAHLVQEENPARMERRDGRVKKAFPVLLDILALRGRKVIVDLLVMVLVPLVLQALEVFQDYKEKKVILVLRESQVHQDGILKGREVNGVRREI